MREQDSVSHVVFVALCTMKSETKQLTNHGTYAKLISVQYFNKRISQLFSTNRFRDSLLLI